MEQFHSDLQPETPIAETTGKSGNDLRQFIVDVIETVVVAVLLFLVINSVSARIRVDGQSMEPTFRDGEFVIVEKVSYRFNSPERGDVVVFHYPRDPEQEYIKRVIGLPGDQIVIQNGKVFVNDKKLNEPYILAAPAYELDIVVPTGELFVLGDNRNNSSDSHRWGNVPMSNVVGKAIFVYWPLTELGVIQSVNAADRGVTP